MAKKIELLHTTYDESGNIESQEVVHPLTSPDCIIMENGKTLDEVMGDGIATPTLTHEGTSFKVGVGDSNIEVVDGDVAGMTLKGQSYQNILPKPTTLIMETDEKEFKINDKIDSNIIIDDNIAEIATVKGKTIVNAVQEGSASEYTVLGEDLSGQSIVTTNKPEGNIKGVTLQGQTLVNTIQEPCKDDCVVLGAEDGIEISAETGGHGTIEDTIQGGINGAVLEGQTLVNIANKRLQNKENTATNGGTSTNYGLLLDGIGYEIAYPLIANKEYLIIEEWNIKSSNNIIHTAQPKYIYEDDTVGYLSSGGEITTLGVHKLARKFIPEKNVKNFYFGLTNKAGNTVSLALNYAMIIEYQQGMENWDIPYFEGMKSVQMPVVKTIGKNLFDGEFNYGGSKVSVGKHFDECFSAIDTKRCYSHLVNVKDMINVTIALTNPNQKYAVYQWDKDKKFLNSSGWKTNPMLTIKLTSGADYISIYVGNVNDSDVELLEFKYSFLIVEGTTATSYEPYQSSTVTIGKNLFDGILLGDYLKDGTGQPHGITTTTHFYTPSYMPIQANEKFRLQVSSDTQIGDGRVYFYDKDYNYLNLYKTGFSTEASNSTSGDTIVTVPNNSNIAYMRVRFYNGIGVQADSVQINKVYELRGIGEVQDELDLTTGKLTQRIGEVVLDGSEEWSINNSDNEGFYSCSTTTYVGEPNGKVICDKLPSITTTKSEGVMMGITTGKLMVSFDRDKTGVTSLTTFKKKLAELQLKVCYELATPIIKTIDLTVTDQDGNTIPHIQTQPTVTHITASSEYLIPTVTINGNLVYDTIIKPSTLYTVRFRRNTVNTDNPLTVDLGGTTQTVTSTEFTITTPSTLTHNQLVFSGKNNVVSEVQVIEGDVTNIKYPFFEGMGDVQITDMIRNVNLFDINDTVPGYLGATGKEIKVPDHGNLTSNYIKVKPDTTYVYNHGGFTADFADYWTGMYFYQDDRGTESNLYTGGSHNRFVYTGQGKQYTNFKFTTPSDCEYIRIGSRGLSYDGAWATLYQLDNFSDSKFVGRGKNLMYIPSDLQTIGGHQSTITLSYSKGIITLTGKTTVEDNTERYVSTNAYAYLKGGKTYTISFESDAKASGVNGTDTVEMFLAWENKYQRDENGLLEFHEINAKTKTIKPNLTGKYYLRLDLNKASGTTHSFYNIQVEEGSTATSYESYKCAEVQQDVDSIPLTSDMFVQGTLTVSSIISGMSLQQIPTSTNNLRMYSKLIKVKPNTIYSCMNFGSILGLWYLEFDKDGLYFGERKYKQNNVFQTTHNTEYVSVCLYYIDESAITPSTLDSMNLILQEVPQEIVLRGIGDVKDELDLTRGEYIQRIKEFVLDGSENWTECTEQHGENTMLFQCREVGCSTISNQTTDGFMCSQLKSVAASPQWINDEQCISLNITNAIGIRVSKTNATNKNEFLSWLQKEPITIQCRLNVPIIHKVNLTNTKVIPSYATETHYETITPSDSLIPNITIPSTLNYNVAIKPSTEYTIRANTSDNLTVDLGGATGTLSNGKVTLTTPATLTHNEVKFSGTGKVKELMVVEGNEIKDNVPFFNGMKDVQMGGIKLVNIARGAVITGTDVVSTNANQTQFTYNGISSSFKTIKFDNSLLKPNTTYTMYLNITKNTSTLTKPIKFLYSGNNYFIDLGGTGIKKVVVTTPKEIERIEVAFRPCTTSQEVVIQNPMIIEGDWTHLDEIPFIESEMIIDQPIIRSQGKNLLDLETKYFNPPNVTYTKSGTTYTVVGNTSNYNHGQFAWTTETSAWFRNLLGKEVTLSVSSISCTNANSKACIQVRMECTDGSKIYHVISINDDLKYETFTIPSNAKDMALQLMSNNTGSPLDSESTLTVSNIQLELGNTATSYEAYKHQTLYSNRVIGYEDGCYYAWDTAKKMSSGSIASVMSNVEGLNVAYVTHASSNFSFYDKDGVYLSGSMYLSTATSSNANDNFDKFGFVKIPENAKYMKMACGNANSAAAKDYHLKATVTGELPLRSLPNGVCDTLNLVTGEYVQRVGEVVLDGSDDEFWKTYQTNDYGLCQMFTETSDYAFPNHYTVSNKLPNINDGFNNVKLPSIRVPESRGIYIRLKQEWLYESSETGFKQYLSQNPITVQYELATPIVRKLDFTTKGNYTEFIMDETKTWRKMDKASDGFIVSRYVCHSNKDYKVGNIVWVDNLDFISKNMDGEGYDGITSNFCYIMIDENKLSEDTIDGFKQWLSQNPVKASYLTNKQSSESYSNIHKPIFFNNVDVQFLPQNVDIQPQLTLQARTKNSYVMDMMKANTKYSLKLLTSSGNMKIDGISYTLANNRTFISPSTLTNKELIILGGWYEPMIIEGSVTGKNLPYFKGILSSYHDVDEIEVYSYNNESHNTTLIKMPTRLETVKIVRPVLENGSINSGTGANYNDGDSLVKNVRTKDYLPVQPGEIIKFYNNGQGRAVNINYYDINKQFVKYEFYDGLSTKPTVPKDCYFVRMYCGKSACSDITLTRQAYKPIQLNSLPNGVYDEIIMKPNSNKAQLVQRVGKVVLDGSEDILTDSVVMTSDYTLNEISTYLRVNPTSFTLQKSPSSYNGQPNMLCDSLVVTSRQESQQTIPNSICLYTDGFGMRPKNDVNNALSLRTYLQENPITVYYELATPIIHEIQLKGYPHVYENGTVTLNTDTPHQTLVSYNVNQEQLINTQNETIIRHDQQIDDLYYYIEMYLEEIYQMELFRMKLELSL